MVSRARIPRMVPSWRTATATSMLSSRAWEPTVRCSLRSSTHFTDRPSSRAAAVTATSSRLRAVFAPKAPPTSPVTVLGRVFGSRPMSPTIAPFMAFVRSTLVTFCLSITGAVSLRAATRAGVAFR